MARKGKVKESNILRYIELIKQRSDINSEIDELKELFADDIDFAIPDEKKENVVHIVVGKSKVTITTVMKSHFDSKQFGKDHPKMKEQYTTKIPEDRITATTNR